MKTSGVGVGRDIITPTSPDYTLLPRFCSALAITLTPPPEIFKRDFSNNLLDVVFDLNERVYCLVSVYTSFSPISGKTGGELERSVRTHDRHVTI